jgi:hypothetical protein
VLYSLMPILAHGYLLVILLWSPYVDSHLFCKFGMVMDIIAQIYACMPWEAP